jgi:hypothetical protein
MLGNFFEYFLETGSNGGVVWPSWVTTSGDTGSAAIYTDSAEEGRVGTTSFCSPMDVFPPFEGDQMTTVGMIIFIAA